MIVSYSENAHGVTLTTDTTYSIAYLKVKVTVEHSFKELPISNFLIENENCQITTDIHRKPTDSQPYLHFNSHHPKKLQRIHLLLPST